MTVDNAVDAAADGLGPWLHRLSQGFAIFGGLILVVVTMLTVVSVVGGAVFRQPLLGDSEIVEVGCAFAIFAFMPYCHMQGANVIVDFMTAHASLRTRNALDAIANVLFALTIVVLTWRLAIGGLDALRHNDLTMFLRIPIWVGYLGASVSSLLWIAVCVHIAHERLRGRGGGGHGGSIG